MQHDLLTMDELRLALTHIPADDRDTWVNIGNAVKTEYGDDGFFAWDEWSQGGDSYNAKDAQSVWKSLQAGHVRLGTIIKLAGQHGWKRERKEMSADDRKRMKAEQEERRKARQAEIEADEKRREAMRETVAMACRHFIKKHCQREGKSAYLDAKQVEAFGVWFPRCSVVISIDDQAQRADVWPGMEVKRFFDDLPQPRPDHISFMRIQQGDVVVPLRDVNGKVVSIQVIKPNGTKLFPKYGRKSGTWHRIGAGSESQIVAVAEGYATAASIHMATGWPVAVAMDAGNLQRVVPLLGQLYQGATLVVCGDDDPQVKDNPGRKKAEEIAQAMHAVAVFPQLSQEAA
ncbi:PriCT-2 domain-containing protein [Halomonas sp. FeN2]|uniref:PriCT-2 domain-containing protein n=1 Tax=Halomonas sp. FeN2 TaxID=2832500 RepID=UPI001D0A38DA|nr:PriCT-2 domain-containing protein [Halomonas sp. FeN2]UBR49800.1 PriCT-2 domain-containing protein [Halomonas sp. FeN2]